MAMKQLSLKRVNSHGRNSGNGHSPKSKLHRNGRSNNGDVTNGNISASVNGHADSAVCDKQVAGGDDAKRVAELLMSLMRDIFAVDDQASELPVRQLRVCAMLYEGSRSMSSLSRELGVSLSAMTQIADRLERAGLVKRAFEGNDRRVRCLQLTLRAQRIMRLREKSRIQRASAALEQLAPEERKNVLTTLQALRSACCATLSMENNSTTSARAAIAWNGTGARANKL
jgi:DNA-binding MarR family transcriptional regulator